MEPSALNQAARLQLITTLRQAQARLPGDAAGALGSTDRVELSNVARQLGELGRDSKVRLDLVEGIREQIRAGTYESPVKLDQAIDTLVEELFGDDPV